MRLSLPLRCLLLVMLLVALLAGAGAAAQPAAGPGGLRAGFEAARAQGTRQILDRPLYLQSTDVSDTLQGDVHALIDHPYRDVRLALASAQAGPWCDVLILHLNVKYCRAAPGPAQAVLDAGVGRKFDQPLDEVHWLRFGYRLANDGADYFRIELHAPSGPLGTKDYRIAVEAMPYADGRTLLHMTYAYGHGLAARWAMQAYLATLGHDKVGFSVEGTGRDGQPVLVGGLRGVLERNTLRYYLAIEVYLDALDLPADQRMQRRLQDWFAATERYARQLHEIDREAYLEMKRREVQRQQAGPPPARR